MAGKARSKAPERPVGQPGDAAERAFKRMRWEHSGIPRPPDARSALVVFLLLVVSVAVVALIMDRDRPDQPDFVFDEISDEEARDLPEPADLGPAPDLGPLVNWALVPEEIDYANHVTVMWMRRQLTCTGCGTADGYMLSMHDRYAGDGLQVVDVLHIAEVRFERETFDRPALPDAARAIAQAFVGTDEVPAHYVVIVDDRGHIRYAAATWPDYSHMETILAKLLVDL